MPANAETLQRGRAEADRAETTLENLCLNLVQFITYVLQVRWEASGRGHATELAQSPRDNFIENECDKIAFEKVEEWAGKGDAQRWYDEPSLLLHKHMFDITVSYTHLTLPTKA